MAKINQKKVKQYFQIAIIYFEKLYLNGASLHQIKVDEENALKDYLNLFKKNIQNGKNKYNSQCNKARNKWFILETIEKILKINNLDFAKNLDFCITDEQEQVQKFIDNVYQEEYESYFTDDDLIK